MDKKGRNRDLFTGNEIKIKVKKKSVDKVQRYPHPKTNKKREKRESLLNFFLKPLFRPDASESSQSEGVDKLLKKC